MHACLASVKSRFANLIFSRDEPSLLSGKECSPEAASIVSFFNYVTVI